MAPTALAIRHVAFEDLGVLEPLLAGRGYGVRYVEAGVDDIAGLDAAAPDLVVVLGGPIGVYEEAVYPFLSDEIRFVERRLAGNRPIIGICLGAQLMARAAGERVYPGPAKEIGFAPITLSAAGQSSPLAQLDDAAGMVLHWHGDTFDLPRAAERLASTAMTLNQAFAIGNSALGLQFHMEAEPRHIEKWLIGHAAELAAARVDVPGLRADAARLAGSVAAAGRAAFSAWLDQCGTRA